MKPKFYGQCMICDYLFKEEAGGVEDLRHRHVGHPDSCWDSNGNHRPVEEAAKAQDRSHVGWIKRTKRECNCRACNDAKSVESRRIRN